MTQSGLLQNDLEMNTSTCYTNETLQKKNWCKSDFAMIRTKRQIPWVKIKEKASGLNTRNHQSILQEFSPSFDILIPTYIYILLVLIMLDKYIRNHLIFIQQFVKLAKNILYMCLFTDSLDCFNQQPPYH